MTVLSEIELYPLLFEPIYMEIMWGGNLLSEHLGRKLPERPGPIAESWEIVDREDAESIVENGPLAGTSIRTLLDNFGTSVAGELYSPGTRFPLLVKLIDAGKRLSLQVHPDEESCRELEGAEPKTEMWYVLAAEPHAKIIAGLTPCCTTYKFSECVGTDKIEECLQVFPSVPGDAFFIKAGTVHAIGAGNLLLEIQQNSNTTYRISDWGRVGLDGKPRELHIEQALQCINFSDRTSPRIAGASDTAAHNRKFPIVNMCPHFQVDELRLVGQWVDATQGTTLHLITAVTTPVTVVGKGGSLVVDRGRTCLIPANYGNYHIGIGDAEETTVIKTTLK